MKRPELNRRSFLKGLGGLALGMAGAQLSNLAFAKTLSPTQYNQEIVVIVFLRGGWDALNVLLPLSDADYNFYSLARPNIKIPQTGANGAINLDGQFGLHPAMAPLVNLFQSKKLAFVHAVGLAADTRSHFDAQMFIELGTPGVKTTSSGWLARLIQNTPGQPPNPSMPALSVGNSQPMALEGINNAVTMNSPADFALYGNWQYELAQRAALRDLYSGTSWQNSAGIDTLNMIDLIESTTPGKYVPANGAVYPQDAFGDSLQTLAQMIKMQLGLRVATLDVGGWDTHQYQGDHGTGYLATNLLAPLASGLAALYTDLDGGCGADFNQHLTVVVMSEFGRRLNENANHGTDHGHGNLQLILGGNVKGGKIYGQWPGLSNDQLYDNADLAVTTDFRSVLSEIARRRLNITDQTILFPGFTSYSPLDLVLDAYPSVVTPPGQTPRLFMPMMNTQSNLTEPCK